MKNIPFSRKLTTLVNMPEWEFIVVMGQGFFDEACAGCEYKGVYCTENDLYQAYFLRNPNAEPLV